jgi:glycosyltransferase involved in cell wall biosynthesis
MDRHHILLVPSWYPVRPDDVKGCFFRDQALALADYGHRVGVIDVQFRSLREMLRPATLLRAPSGVVEETDGSINTVRFHGLNWTGRIRHLDRRRWLWRGRQLAARYFDRFGRPDLLHAHSMFNGGLLAMELSANSGIPYVVTEHGSGTLMPGLDSAELSLLGRVAGNAARRLAVSASLCRALEERLGSTQLKSKMTWDEVPNVLSPRYESAVLTPARRGPFTFLTVSLLTRNKAVDVLIRAFVKAFPGGDVRLNIGGDGPDRMRLESLVDELGIKDRVHFLGLLARDDVPQVMAASSVFVLPSHIETFGVVLIESLALGRPVISTRSGGPESIVREADGLLVPTNDPGALAAAMCQIKSHYDDYDGAKIRQACVERYGGRAIARRLTEIYDPVLRNAI